MKKYLKNNEGMALPMVLIIMAILMTFATSLALFAYDSLLSVKWMSNDKKAYYLSRAGIEAASYAYQVASTGSTDYRDISNLDSLDAISKVVAAAKAGAPITTGTENSAAVKSNTIYAYYTTDDQEGNRFSGIQFKTSGNLNDDYCIGSFVVEIGKGIDLRQYSAPGEDSYEQSTLDVVTFRCTASCGDDSNRRNRTTYAYISETESASRKQLYDDYGVLKPESFVKEPEVTININTGQTSYPTNDNRFIIGFINNINNFFKGIFKQFLIEILGGPTKTVQPYSFAHSGSLILDTPLKAKTIKAPGTVIEKNDNVVDHLYVVETSENLFIKTGIDASAEKTGFTMIGLYGDQFVVDGDITMEVYITNPDALLANNPFTIMAAQTRFRIGTVIIGNATESAKQIDPIGGIKYMVDNKSVTADNVNKIFFNGNVNLKIYTQGATTQTYRVFSAGDIAYFYGNFITVEGETESQGGGSKGIDLLKFFIDASLADLEGFKQNDATKRKLEQVKKLYYASDNNTYEPYVTADGKTVLMRKIIVEEKTDGYYVDGSKSNIKEIIQPSEGAGAKLTWGRPRHGDVWNNFEKVS